MSKTAPHRLHLQKVPTGGPGWRRAKALRIARFLIPEDRRASLCESQSISYKDKRGPRYAPAKRWRIISRPTADLHIRCLPYLIIKLEQTEIAIRFHATYTIPGEKANESDKLLRERFKRELRALTRRGPRPIAKEPVKEISNQDSTRKRDLNLIF